MKGRNAALISRLFPSYRSPKRAYEAALQRHVEPGIAWLDIGCGRKLTADAALNEELTRRAGLVVGCDADPHLERHTTIRDLTLCDAAKLPFADDTFDLVTTSMVAEHLRDPDQVFAEVARVSKDDAVFIVFTPNKWNYAMIVARFTPHAFHLLYKRATHYLNRGSWESFEDDVFPTYYRANTINRLNDLMRTAGFGHVQVERLSFAHSFGFVRPLYALSLLFERLIDRWPLDVLKADLLAVGSKRPAALTAHPVKVKVLQDPAVPSHLRGVEAVSARQGGKSTPGRTQ